MGKVRRLFKSKHNWTIQSDTRGGYGHHIKYCTICGRVKWVLFF